MKDFIERLQNKPYEARVKILWGTVVIVAIVLVLVWALTIKSSVTGLSDGNLLGNSTNQTIATRSEDVARVEYIERSSKEFKIYFNIKNSTNNILNFSPATAITLRIKDQDYHPTGIFDRQGNPYVRKVLSNSQEFGILVFGNIEGSEGTLIFDEMMYENSTSDYFKQELILDFDKLDNKSKLRD